MASCPDGCGELCPRCGGVLPNESEDTQSSRHTYAHGVCSGQHPCSFCRFYSGPVDDFGSCGRLGVTVGPDDTCPFWALPTPPEGGKKP